MNQGLKEARTASTLNYFSLLGVGEEASQDEIEARYQELSAYFAEAQLPAALREWAQRQAALIDEAYAVLSDPDQRLALRREAAPVTPTPEPRADEGGDAAAVTPQREPEARPKAAVAETRTARPLGLRPLTLLAGLAVGAAVLGAILLLRSGLPFGGDDAASLPDAQAGDFVPLDRERVSELMATVQSDPNNRDALFELGESFFLAGEWQSAIDWFTQFVELESDNVHALTDIGTSNFNLGQVEEAKKSWQAALKFDPNDIQVHYNLGFMYANAEPQDIEAAKKEWQTVVALAEKSTVEADRNLAQTAQVHLQGLSQATPTPAPQPTPTP